MKELFNLNLNQLIGARLGVDPEHMSIDEVLATAKSLLDIDERKSDALLLCIMSFSKASESEKEQLNDLIAAISGNRIMSTPERVFIDHYSIKESLGALINCDNSSKLSEIGLGLAVIGPHYDETLLVLLFCKHICTQPNVVEFAGNFIEDALHAHPFPLRLLLNSIERISAMGKAQRSEIDLRVLDELIRLVRKYMEPNGNELLSMYHYFLYIEDSEACELILELFEASDLERLEKFSIDEDYVSVSYSSMDAKKRYLKVREAWDLGKKSHIKTVTDRLNSAWLSSLVPNVLYARHVGDAEYESFMLWLMVKKVKIPGVFERMKELSGYEVSVSLKNAKLEDVGKWLSNRLEELGKIDAKSHLDELDIRTIKKIYAVQPFNEMLLGTMFKAYDRTHDKDIRAMIRESISRIASGTKLSTLLARAIIVRNAEFTKLLVSRILELNLTEFLVKAVENAVSLPEKFVQSTADLTSDVLETYKASSQNFKADKYQVFSSFLRRFKKQKGTALLSASEKVAIAQGMKYSVMLFNRKYDELISMLEIDVKSPAVAEIILKAAIAKRGSSDVVRAYGLLASLSRKRVVFYNMEVEPFFLIHNYKLRNPNQRMEKNLVSGVWGNVHLENPVDKQALALTFKVRR